MQGSPDSKVSRGLGIIVTYGELTMLATRPIFFPLLTVHIATRVHLIGLVTFRELGMAYGTRCETRRSCEWLVLRSATDGVDDAHLQLR